MIRSNVGNVVTNAVQIGSVGATTYAGFERSARRAKKEDAASAFNYLTEDDLSKIGQAKAQRMKDEAERYSSGGSSPFQHLEKQEASDFQAKKAEEIRKYAYGKDESSDDVDVDKILQSLSSEQSDRIKSKVSFDTDFIKSLK